LALFAELNPNPVLRLSAAGEPLYANPSTANFLEGLDISPAELTKLFPLDLQRYLGETRESKALYKQFESVYGIHILEWSVVYMVDLAEFNVYIKDVTLNKRAEERLAYQAFFDSGTGLPNKNKLRDELNMAFVQARYGAVIPVMMMMIVADREQDILESFGAAETEKWLVKIAQRLRDALDENEEKLFRIGGNSFILLCLSRVLPDAKQRAAQLLSSAQRPIRVEGHELLSTVSIGVSQMHCDTRDDAASRVEMLVQQAASACNRVRRARGNDFEVYDDAMGQAAVKALRLASDLQSSVENNELTLLYQPKVDAMTGRLLGMEALVRWVHPERGVISPTEFIPVAEDTGLIVAIGQWVLREACQQNAEWQRAGLRPLRVAVNLSALQFRSGGLLKEIDAILEETGLAVDSLELEITESMVMEDPESVIKLLGSIHDRGVHLSLDDFGTGHSSLAYLKRFPIDCLKVDRAFIKDTPGNTDDVAILKTIFAMAHALDLATVAEGVENAAQLELLRKMGCGQIQGFFFSRPLTATDFLIYYRAHIEVASGLPA
jgi:diguanylate cyclase (GGDEF)-like protein